MNNKMSDWIDINIRYIKTLNTRRLDDLLEDSEEYTACLDELLRTKYLELSKHSFDKYLARFEELFAECSTKKDSDSYDAWENKDEFISMREKIDEINEVVNKVMEAGRKKIEYIRKKYIERETIESFVGLGLNKPGTEIEASYIGSTFTLTLTSDIMKLLEVLGSGGDSFRVIKYRVPLENVSN